MFDGFKREEKAVSPVVGVMLMLVVTILLGAVVSSFSGSIASKEEKVPAASISVHIKEEYSSMTGNTVKYAIFEHLSGDPLPTKDLRIITYYTLPNGTVIKNSVDKDSPLTDFGWTEIRIPFLNDMRGGYASSNPEKWFGNFTLMTGDIMETGASYGSQGLSSLLGFDVSNTTYGFGRGSTVEIKIMHIPSGKYILDKEVVVE